MCKTFLNFCMPSLLFFPKNAKRYFKKSVYKSHAPLSSILKAQVQSSKGTQKFNRNNAIVDQHLIEVFYIPQVTENKVSNKRTFSFHSPICHGIWLGFQNAKCFQKHFYVWLTSDISRLSICGEVS